MSGELDVKKILGRPWKWFRDWEIYASLEPFGWPATNLLLAAIRKTIADVNRGKDQEPYKLEDFLLEFAEKKEKVPQTVEEQIAIAKIMVMAANANPKDL